MAEEPVSAADLQRQVEELAGQVQSNRDDIDELQIHEAESRARADASDVRVEANHQRIEDLESRADVDAKLIAELRADGLLSREHEAHLEEALRTSRKIGAAMGIVMANRRVAEDQAFETLKNASQLANRKVRVLAEEVVRTGDVSELPDL